LEYDCSKLLSRRGWPTCSLRVRGRGILLISRVGNTLKFGEFPAVVQPAVFLPFSRSRLEVHAAVERMFPRLPSGLALPI